jgi:hypothetical protein
LFDVRGTGCSVADSFRAGSCVRAALWQYPLGTFGSSLAASFRCRLAGTLAGRAGSCLAGGAGRVLAWRVNGTTGQALRNSDPAGRQLRSAQLGSWCVLPHRSCNRNRALCFLAVSDRQSAGYVGQCASWRWRAAGHRDGDRHLLRWRQGPVPAAMSLPSCRLRSAAARRRKTRVCSEQDPSNLLFLP